MNYSDNSYYEILGRLKYFADNHYMINSFSHGQVAQLDTGKSTAFPIMHVVPVDITRVQGEKLFTFDVIFADLPRSKDNKTENQKEVISDCDRLADDLVNEITNGGAVFGNLVSLSGNAKTEPFMEEYSNVLTGVVLQITLAAPYTFNACDIPASWNSNDGTPPQFGSRDLTLDVYDEQEFEVAARSMDFRGSGVTVTHEGNRAIVTISGGGGGGGIETVTGDSVDNTDPLNPVVNAIPLAGTVSGSPVTGDIELSNAPRRIYDIFGDSTREIIWDDENGVKIKITDSVSGNECFIAVFDSQIQIQSTNGTSNYLYNFSVTNNGIIINSSDPNFEGVLYATDYSANFTARSLVDKEYVDGLIGGLTCDDLSDCTVIQSLDSRLDTAESDIDTLQSTVSSQGSTISGLSGDVDQLITDTTNLDGRITTTESDINNLESGKEPTIAAGTTSQYWRGDKSWQTLDKSAVGLGNVDNTSDANKPVSTAQQTALDLKVNKADIWRHVNVTDSASVTNATSITKVASILIPANTFTAGYDILTRTRLKKTGTVGSTSVYWYFNTSDSVTGATLAATLTSGSSNLFLQMKRDILTKSGGTEVFRTNLSASSDDIATNVAPNTLTIDWTVDQYFILAILATSSSDSYVASLMMMEGRKTIS
jgi:hypothetical protein